MDNLLLYTKESYLPKVSTKQAVAGERESASYELKHLSGMNSKTLNVKEAYPSIILTSNPSQVGRIMLIEPLGIGANDMNSEECLRLLKENSALKIIWTEEQQLLRINEQRRKALFTMSKMLVCCNTYQQNMLSSVNNYRGNADKPLPSAILPTPIPDFFKPKKKTLKIVAMGKICPEKNISAVIRLFKALPDTFEKVYIGSHAMWGEPAIAHNVQLERELERVVDRMEAYETREEVAAELSDAWGYFNTSIYDVGCLSFLEAASSGCHCFAWSLHPMFDAYLGVHRFENEEDGVEKIVNVFQEKKLAADDILRDFVRAQHSYQAFVSQLKSIVMEVLFDGKNVH